MIYFIRDPLTELVKIGFSDTVRQRLFQLKAEYGDGLMILGVEDGNRVGERILHKKFAADRETGEWFRSSAELMAYVRDHAKPLGVDRMKRITLEIDDDVHAGLVEKAKADDRSLVKYLARLLAKDAGADKKAKVSA